MGLGLKRLMPLVLQVAFIWASLLALGLLLALMIDLIRTGIPLLDGILRVGTGFGAGLLWLYLWKKLTGSYFWKALRRRRPVLPN